MYIVYKGFDLIFFKLFPQPFAENGVFLKKKTNLSKKKAGKIRIKSVLSTMNYPKIPGFNLHQSRYCAYITYIVKTWFLKILSVSLFAVWWEFSTAHLMKTPLSKIHTLQL